MNPVKDYIKNKPLTLEISRNDSNRPNTKSTAQAESPLLYGVRPQDIGDGLFSFSKSLRHMNSIDEETLVLETPNIFRDRPFQLNPNDLANSMMKDFGSIKHLIGPNDSSLDINCLKDSIIRINAASEEPVVNAPAFEETCTNLKRFAKLFRALAKLFCGNRIEMEDYAMDTSQREILEAIIEKKFAKKGSRIMKSKSDAEMIEWINNMVQNPSSKRPEECYKFILTKAFKYLRKKFEKNQIEHRLPHEDFYEHYFGEISKSMDLPISHFHYPPNHTTAKKAQTFKIDFFKRLFQSEVFKVDALEFVHNHLWKEYKIKICKKLERFLSEREKKIIKDSAKEAAIIQELKNYLLNNRKCKLPWTLYDIKAAIEKLAALIE